jgi:hypothetical protein
MTGLALIGITGLYLSFFLPLNEFVQLLFIIPSFLCWLFQPFRNVMKNNIRQAFNFIPRIGLLLFLLCLMMILVISSYHIIHPDTLGYHLQSIIWFENFKAVPGIVHIDQELGLQSLWFGAQAVFRPKIFDQRYIFFLNGAVLCWYFIFILKFLNFRKSDHQHIFLALLLLTFGLLSWTQVRLTAASASPDFIVSLYILAAAYLFLIAEKQMQGWSGLVFLFTATAVSIKLSALPVMLLPVYLIIVSFQKKEFLRGFSANFLCFIFLIPILIRNTIASGYPLFPSGMMDIVDVTWKQDEQTLTDFRSYIRSYARVADDTANTQLWLRTWWSNLSFADQSLLILLLVLVTISVIRVKQTVQHISIRELWLVITSITGIVLWWLFAPDPRFSTGFLLLLTLILTAINLRTSPVILNKKLLTIYMWLLITGLTGYTIHRFNRFFDVDQLVIPKGAAIGKYNTIPCYTIPVNVPAGDTLCGAIPAPCVLDSCNSIIPLGKTIENGFSPSKK